MGISSSKSTNKPIYASEIKGAYGDLSGAFNSTLPKVQAVTDQVTGLVPSMIEKYNAGDAGVNAARGYITDTLAADPSANPWLDEMVARTNRDAVAGVTAGLGTRGLSGGSVAARIIADRQLANETGLRYNDWNAAMARKAQAAGMASGIAAADTIQIAPLLGVAGAAAAPLDAASQYAAGVGGLLGQYQKQKTTQPWGSMLLNAASNAAQAYAGGG